MARMDGFTIGGKITIDPSILIDTEIKLAPSTRSSMILRTFQGKHPELWITFGTPSDDDGRIFQDSVEAWREYQIALDEWLKKGGSK